MTWLPCLFDSQHCGREAGPEEEPGHKKSHWGTVALILLYSRARFRVWQSCLVYLVPGRELESPHLAIHGPEPCASTNSATRAQLAVYHYFNAFSGPGPQIFLKYFGCILKTGSLQRKETFYQNNSLPFGRIVRPFIRFAR